MPWHLFLIRCVFTPGCVAEKQIGAIAAKCFPQVEIRKNALGTV